MKRRIAISVVCATAALSASAIAGAREPVYYTDFNSGPAVRPVYIDGNRNVRSGPFRHWRGWGTARATATHGFSYHQLRITVVLREIRTCAGRRQYRVLRVYTSENGHRTGRTQRFVNRACR